MTNENENKTYIVKFSKPFTWEGNEYKSVDLSAIENLTGEQLCEAYKRFGNSGVISALPEQSPEFASIIASMVADMPIEFFKTLGAKELYKIKNRVSMYFFEED